MIDLYYFIAKGLSRLHIDIHGIKLSTKLAELRKFS